MTSCCDYCNRRGKAPTIVKMAASTMDAIDYYEITLIGSDDYKAHNIKVSYKMLVIKIYEKIIILNVNKYCDNICYLLVVFISYIFYYIFLQHI